MGRKAKIIDIVTAKKGGAGKTLISLYKLDVALSAGCNVIALDLNDMNPDFSEILTNIVDACANTPKLPDNIKIKEVSSERLLTGDLSYREYIFGSERKLIIISPRFKHRISSLDIQRVLYDVSNELLIQRQYDIVIVDTNTNYETLTPWYANVDEEENFSRSMPSVISKCLGEIEGACRGYRQGIDEIRSGLQKIGKNKGITILLSYILPLSSLLSRKTFEIETLRISLAVEKYWKKMIINVVPCLIINAYIPLVGIALIDRIKSYGRKISKFLKRLGRMKKEKKAYKYVIQELDEIRRFLCECLKDIGQANVKSVIGLLKENVYNVFSGLVRNEYNTGNKIANFFVIPIYDQEFSDIFACLLDRDRIQGILQRKGISGGIISDIFEKLGVARALSESEAPMAESLSTGDYLTINDFLLEYKNRYKALLELIMNGV